jgi:hypothetical protein
MPYGFRLVEPVAYSSERPEAAVNSVLFLFTAENAVKMKLRS